MSCKRWLNQLKKLQFLLRSLGKNSYKDIITGDTSRNIDPYPHQVHIGYAVLDSHKVYYIME